MMAETQHFCLRWNNYQSSITSAFENLRDDEDFVDVTLACDGKSLKAHRVVLSACSPYFRELLKSTPCKHPVIVLQDVAFADLHALVEFIYHGEVNVHQRNLSSFLKTAEVLRVSGLTQQADEREEEDPSHGLQSPRQRCPQVPVPPHNTFLRSGLHHNIMDDSFFTSPHSPPIHSTPTSGTVNQLLRRAAMAGGGGMGPGFGRRERRTSPEHQHHPLQDPSAETPQHPATSKRARTSEPAAETSSTSNQQQPTATDFSSSSFPQSKSAHQGNVKLEADGNDGPERNSSPSPNGRSVMDGVKSEPTEHCGSGGDVENSTDSVEQAEDVRQQSKPDQDEHDSVQGQAPSYLSPAESKLFGSITSASGFNFSMAALAADPLTGLSNQSLQGNADISAGTSTQGEGMLSGPPLPAWLPIQGKIQNEILLEAERGFICPECGKVLRSAITLKRHVLDLHRFQTEQFWCEICRKSYRTKNSLVVHLSKYHQKKKSFLCALKH